MIKRFVPAALAATGLIAAMMVGAPAASADCAITDYSPHTVVVGLTAVDTTFSLKTACVPPVWDLTISLNGLVYFTDKVNPTTTFDPADLYNSDAGPYNATTGAGPWVFVRAYDDQLVPTGKYFTNFAVKRGTKWTGFNASPEPVTKGQPIKITGSLKTANWDSMTWGAQKGSAAVVEFKAAGTTTWKAVKQVTTSSTYGTVSTTVTATVDGTWRLRYGGSSTRGASTSSTDYVDVR